MFDAPLSAPGRAHAGGATVGPPSSASLTRSGGTSWPGFVYEFHDDNDRRCLYVGKAGPGNGGPGYRILDHYQKRQPWALAATTIRVTPFPGITDDTLLEVERRRIEALRPRGNRQANWAHHDDAWMRRTRLNHDRANGAHVSNIDVLVVWMATVRARARQARRLVVQTLVVDAVVLAVTAGVALLAMRL